MTLEEAVRQSQPERGEEYPDVFNENVGLDIVEKASDGEPLHAIKTWGRCKWNLKRRATLRITTWRGISFGAIHYYGKLDVQGVELEFDNKPECTTCSEQNDLAQYLYRLELKRPLTSKEIDEDTDRWRCYHAGDLVPNFGTAEELIALAKEIFRLRFSGDWDFFIVWPSGRKEVFEIGR